MTCDQTRLLQNPGRMSLYCVYSCNAYEELHKVTFYEHVRMFVYTFLDTSIITHNISISSISNYLQVSSLKVTCLSIKKVQLQQLHSCIPFRHGFENAGCLRRYFYHLSGMKMDPWDNRRGGEESWFGKSRLPEGYGPWNQKSMCWFFHQKTMAFCAIGWDVGVLDFETYPTYHCCTSHHDHFKSSPMPKRWLITHSQEKHQC